MKRMSYPTYSDLELEIQKLEEENRKLKEANKNLIIQRDAYCKDYERVEEENKKLKEKLSEVTMISDDEKQSIEHILELEEENKKLKEELEFYKGQYEHSMGEDRDPEIEELVAGR